MCSLLDVGSSDWESPDAVRSSYDQAVFEDVDFDVGCPEEVFNGIAFFADYTELSPVSSAFAAAVDFHRFGGSFTFTFLVVLTWGVGS